MDKPLKYEMLAAEKVVRRNLPFRQNDPVVTVKLRRIRALVDIPLHNVKAGDLGGYVQHKLNLSHEGQCWVGGDAIVTGLAMVKDNALVADNAAVYGEKLPFGQVFFSHYSFLEVGDYAQIRDNGMAHMLSMYQFRVNGTTTIRNNGYTSGNVRDWDISGNARIVTSFFTNHQGRCVTGDEYINNDDKANLCRTITAEGIEARLIALKAGNPVPDAMAVSLHPVEVLALETGFQKALSMGEEEILRMVKHVESEYEAYTHDVVNLIRYPLMVDTECTSTREFLVLLRRIQRVIGDGGVPDKDMVLELEDKFILIEGNARKSGVAKLPESERRTLEKTSQLILLASDEVASENEKQMAFTQAFKQLEGVMDVPDITKEIFRTKIGLKELTA